MSSVRNTLYIGAGEIFMATNSTHQRGVVAAVDTTNDFHLYRIEVVGSNANSLVRVYQDEAVVVGVIVQKTYQFQVASPRVRFGDVTKDASGATGGSQWKSFRAGVSSHY